jgi:hypothetical protein
MSKDEVGFPQELKEKMREKVRVAVADLLPDEMLDKMVQQELENLTKPRLVTKKKMSGGYSNSVESFTEEEISLVGEMVRVEANEKLRAAVRRGMEGWNGHYDSMIEGWVSDDIREWLNDHSEEIIKALIQHMMAGGMAQIFQYVRQELSSLPQQGY